MTHRAHLPRPANNIAGAMGEILYTAAKAECVDLGDMRTVLHCLGEAGWSSADQADYAETAVEYARARMQRRDTIRAHLAGTNDAIAFSALTAIAGTLATAPDPAQAAGVPGEPVPSNLAGLILALLPVGVLLLYGAYLRLNGRTSTAGDEDEPAYGDTTLFGEER